MDNPTLDPRITLLVRPSGTVQLGWDPETALLLTPPAGVAAGTLLELLDLIDGSHSRPQLVWRACEYGITPADMSAILAELESAGLIEEPVDRAPSPPRIRIHGRGPLADSIAAGLARSRIRVSRSAGIGDGRVLRWHVDLVVLADDLVVDPQLAADLVAAGIPHIPVRLRDGKGLVGPLVVPGRTSCLRCADLTRCGYDDEWPHIAAQLLGRVGQATPAAVLATAAVALGQLEAVFAERPTAPPASFNATLEIDLETHTCGIRAWPRHTLCGCWQDQQLIRRTPVVTQ